MTDTDCLLGAMGIDVSEDLLEEVEDGDTSAIWELERCVNGMKKLAKEAEDDGFEDLANEIMNRADELETLLW